MAKKSYCTQNGDCNNCSLVSYGRDCQNKSITTTKETRIGLRLDTETHEICKQLAPEGNVSMWIRSLIRKELDNNKIEKENETMYNNQAMREIERENKRFASGTHNQTNVGATDRYAEEHTRIIEKIIKKYGCTTEVVNTFQNGIKLYRVKDTNGKIVAEYHDI